MRPGSLQLFENLSSCLKEELYNFQSCYGDLGGFMDGTGGAAFGRQPQNYNTLLAAG